MGISRPEKEPAMAGKRRVGTVVSEKVVNAMGELTMHTSTTNSRTMSTVLEQWLVDQGLLKESQRIHGRDHYQELVGAASKVRAASKKK